MSKTPETNHRDSIEETEIRSLKLMRRRLTLGALLGMYLHMSLYKPEIEEAYDDIEHMQAQEREYEAYLAKVAAEKEAKRLEEERIMLNMSDVNHEAFEKDKRAVDEMNTDNLERIEERAEEAKEFKKSLLAYPGEIDMSKIFFLIEYFSQGVAQEDYEIGKEVFRLRIDELDTPIMITKPEHKDLREVVKTFMPEGSHNVLRSSAVESLACNLCKDSQSCVARARMMVMAIADRYPELAHNLYFQEFGDHIRTLVEIDGERYILEGPVAQFPDNQTENSRSRVMPVDAWIQIYAGADEKEYEDQFEMYGPEPEESKVDYKRVTNNLVGGPKKPKGLGNLGTADSWYETGEHTRPHPGMPRDASRSDVEEIRSLEEGQNAAQSAEFLRDKDKPFMTPERISDQAKQYEMHYFDTEIDVAELQKIYAEAEENAKYSIRLYNIAELSLEQAEALLEFSANPDPTVGKEQKVSNLHFPSLKSVDKKVMQHLATFSGQIGFSGFTSLPAEMAEAMYESTTTFSLEIEMLTAEAAAALVGETKKPMFKPVIDETFEFEFVQMPVPVEYMPEFELPEFDTPDKIVINEPIVEPKMQNVRFNGLKYLSVEAAENLARIYGNLTFQNTEINYEAARRLTKHKYRMDIFRNNDDFVRGIIRHEGILAMSGMAQFDQSAYFRGRQGPTELRAAHLSTPQHLIDLSFARGPLTISSAYAIPLSEELLTRFTLRRAIRLMFPLDGQYDVIRRLVEPKGHLTVRLKGITKEMAKILHGSKRTVDVKIFNLSDEKTLQYLTEIDNKRVSINGQGIKDITIKIEIKEGKIKLSDRNMQVSTMGGVGESADWDSSLDPK